MKLVTNIVKYMVNTSPVNVHTFSNCHSCDTDILKGYKSSCLKTKFHPQVQDYKEGTPEEKTFYIELWDVGGSVGSASSVKSTRAVFYNSVNGEMISYDYFNKHEIITCDILFFYVLSFHGFHF